MTRRRTAITGAVGQLGTELVRAFAAAGDEVLALARPEFDITRPADLKRLTAWRPDVVVNSAAWTDVDGCARDPERAMRINGEAAGAVAAAGAAAGALSVQISTNEVFDGELDRPYAEDDEPSPINPYGASKLAGERAVATANPRHLIVRTAWLFGPRGTNFVTKILAAAERARAAGEPLRVVDDEWGNPTWTPLARGSDRLACLRPRQPGGSRMAPRRRAADFEAWMGRPRPQGRPNSPSCRSPWPNTHVPRDRPGAAILDTHLAATIGLTSEWAHVVSEVRVVQSGSRGISLRES